MKRSTQVLGVGVVLSLGLASAGCNGGAGSSSSKSSAAALSSAVGTIAPLATPTSVTARIANVKAVELTWADASTAESGFVIERSSRGGPFAEVGRVGPDVTHHRDVAPELATVFDYRVRAWSGTESLTSTPVNVATGQGELRDTGTIIGPIPYGIAIGDFDNDGDDDVATANDGAEPGRVLLNDNGVLTDSGQLLATRDARWVTSADLDGDRDLDLVFATADGNGIPVFWNDGAGRFSSGMIVIPGTLYAHTVRVADVDGDADLDLVVGRMTGVPDWIYLNQGTGQFKSGTYLNAPGVVNSTDLVVGDVNGDGRVDVVNVGLTFGVRVWRNGGNLVFSNNGALNLGGMVDPFSLTLGDVDGDLDLDLVVGGLNEPARLLVNDGAGNFSPTAQSIGSNRIAYSLSLNDMDGDGDLDLVNGKGDGSIWSLAHRNDGRGTFLGGATLPFSMGIAIRAHAVADMDNDGDLDVVGANILNYGSTGGVGIHRNE